MLSSVHQPNHTFGGRSILDIHRFKPCHNLVVIIVYIFDGSAANDELTEAIIRTGNARHKVCNANVNGKNTVCGFWNLFVFRLFVNELNGKLTAAI